MEDIALIRIIGPIANIGNGQMGIEDTNDLTLGFKMAGYKDTDGAARKFLVKDQDARVDNLTSLALIGSGDRYVGVGSDGKLSTLAS